MKAIALKMGQQKQCKMLNGIVSEFHLGTSHMPQHWQFLLEVLEV